MRRRRLALVLPVVALVLAGCSGDDDGDSLEDQRAAYVEEADAVCREANAEVEDETQPAAIDAVPDFVDRLLAIAETASADLGALEPPEQDVEQIEAELLEPLADDLATGQEYAEQVRAAAEADDGPALLRLVQDRPTTTVDLEFLREYGFVDCVELADLSG